jgi:hypothetical protein
VAPLVIVVEMKQVEEIADRWAVEGQIVVIVVGFGIREVVPAPVR